MAQIKKTLVLVFALSISSVSNARDQKAVHAFRATHPCPVTGERTGACGGWVVDHIKPLCAGGEDRPSNMQWQPYLQSKEKDKIEISFCRCMAKQLAPCILPPLPQQQ